MKKYLNILFLNITNDLLNMILEKLSDWNFTVSFKQVKSCKEIIESIENDNWNFVICEMNTNTSLIGLLKLIKCTCKYIPFIIFSDVLNEEHALKLTKGGISDYIPKSEIYRLQQTIYKIYKNNILYQEKVMENTAAMQEDIVHQEKLSGIGLLASGVAHEINNPLGYIISNIDILNKYFIDINKLLQVYRSFSSNINRDKYIMYLEQIDQIEKSIHLDHILEDIHTIFDDCNNGLRRISYIVNGLNTSVKYNKQNIYSYYNINTGIENVLIFANHQIKQHAEVSKELVSVPNINVVAEKIDQVLYNIIINAIQAISMKDSMKRGLIVIRTYYDKKSIYCEIEDNGIGISTENINKVFDPFFTNKPVGQGIGLGLSISYDIIVNLHGGRLTVKSEYGKGTLFSIILPLNPKKWECLEK